MQYLLQNEQWMRKAACRGMKTDVFFPQRGGSSELAKSTCATCPVRVECRDYAERTGTNYGIWGGATLKRYDPKG